MSKEAAVAEIKRINIAENALSKLAAFANEINLHILPQVLNQLAFHPNQKAHADQKETDAQLLDRFKKKAATNNDWAIISEHYNLQVMSPFNQTILLKKAHPPIFQNLIYDAARAVNQHIKDCIKNTNPISPEINYFYILYYLRTQLLQYWFKRDELVLNPNNSTHLEALYSQNLQIQMLLEGFKKILDSNNPLNKILAKIATDFVNEEYKLAALISDKRTLQENAERTRKEQTAIYPAGNITTDDEFAVYLKNLATAQENADQLAAEQAITNVPKFAAEQTAKLFAQYGEKVASTPAIKFSYYSRLGILPPRPRSQSEAEAAKKAATKVEVAAHKPTGKVRGYTV